MYDRIKGFRDVYPPEMAAQRAVIDTIESVARRYGFQEIATPALERIELYIDKSGDEIVEELFAFEDRGGRSVALTPELTPTVARMVVDKHRELTKPIKWYSTRPFWRYEQVQQGRFREFYQTNVDIFGSDVPIADAEILAFAADALVELGLSGADFEFRISHRDILGALIQAISPEANVRAGIRAVDKRDSLDREAYHAELQSAGLSAADAETFDEILDGASDDLDILTTEVDDARMDAAVGELQAVLAAVDDFGVREYCHISLDTARGLDYYTGTVFECFDTAGDVNRAIFGGGRYDDLIESVGGPSMPAVGVAPGVMNSTLPLLLKRADAWPGEQWPTDYYVLSVGETQSIALRIATDLRAAGNVVVTDIADRSFGAQLDYADSIGAETVIIVGDRDVADGVVTIKDMVSGAQVRAPIDDVPGDRVRPTIDDFDA